MEQSVIGWVESRYHWMVIGPGDPCTTVPRPVRKSDHAGRPIPGGNDRGKKIKTNLKMRFSLSNYLIYT
ncbi:hypothetical protein ACN38_g1579 [Penicillium nordicum]|uniref:Uncharacterized protein n=1 Tax=Penicillium nordicum TaxID=229535 RepID=A0A0M8PG28_9EURO|nr:hypothetical protein ACN38_g1579 [Penicillium nordicum]